MAGVQAGADASAAAVSQKENASSSAADAEADSGDAGAHESHPLQFEWTLWHDQPGGKGKTWGSDLRPVASFRTVEEFWALFNNLLEPSRLPVGHTYSLFKHGIKPEWEDKTLSNGGFEAEESEDIAGVVVNIRKGGNRIAIWTISSLEEELQRTIGNRWRQAAIQTQNQMEYYTFKNLMKGGSKKRHTYTV